MYVLYKISKCNITCQFISYRHEIKIIHAVTFLHFHTIGSIVNVAYLLVFLNIRRSTYTENHDLTLLGTNVCKPLNFALLS
jgi:hypothetical protein